MRKSSDMADATGRHAQSRAAETRVCLDQLDTALLDLLAKRIAQALRLEAQPNRDDDTR